MTGAITKQEEKQPKKASPVDMAMLGLMAEFTKRDARLENLLPADVSVERFKESIRLALAKTPALLKCDPGSVLLAVMKAARCGLDVAGVYGHLVPYGAECQFVPDFKGLVALAVATGVVQDVQPVLVYEKDEFAPEEGENPHIHHRPFVPRKAGEARGAIIAAYTRVLLPSGQRVVKGLILMDDIARVEAGVSANKSPWKGPHRPEMVKKTSIKNGFKTIGLPTSEQAARLREAMAAHDESDVVDGSFTLAPPALSGIAGAKENARKALEAKTASTRAMEITEPPTLDDRPFTPEEKAAILKEETRLAEPGSEG